MGTASDRQMTLSHSLCILYPVWTTEKQKKRLKNDEARRQESGVSGRMIDCVI